jgi:hypothetical protein
MPNITSVSYKSGLALAHTRQFRVSEGVELEEFSPKNTLTIEVKAKLEPGDDPAQVLQSIADLVRNNT